MNTLMPHIIEWFVPKQEYFTTFAQADSRVEGWFKAELIVLFNRLQAQGIIDGFEREMNMSSPKDGKRMQVDFQIKMQNQNHLCELKAPCISQAAGTPRNLRFYFRDDHVGLLKDFKKLDDLGISNTWVLAFIYPSPDLKVWSDTITSIPGSLKHWQPVTRPQDFPNWVYISLWKGR